MKLQRLLLAVGCILALLLAHSSRTTEARHLIFYSPHSKTLTGQLLISQRVKRPCPAGKMRDHRDRCRRAVIFARNK
ncbi:uncharacterized protein LOC115765333 [Drosophila novamexicana]|uniref:uncharacterized protein LOC115765333 n=1 Tax=Drosophila novamexicana TaxID=47314 RepID=UPI0011E5FD75|nr:uncharacterized protein LOC115765333 [Drosophila novamexicana]